MNSFNAIRNQPRVRFNGGYSSALNVLEGTVIGRRMQRHRHEEFIRFLNTVEREVPADKAIHAIIDNYGTHKRPKVPVRLEGVMYFWAVMRQ